MSAHKDDAPCRSELKRFCTLTSLKGVSRAVRTEVRGLRVVWVVAVVVFLGVTVYNVYSLTHQYLLYQSSTKIEEQDVDYIRETATDIMLCNINPFSVKLLDVTLHLLRSYEKLIMNWTNNQVRSFLVFSLFLLTQQKPCFALRVTGVLLKPK